MLTWGGCTDLGRTRPINEDGYYISDYSREYDTMYAIVADGMGGHRAGEIASALAIEEICAHINRGFCVGMSVPELKELLVASVKQANRSIYEKSQSEKDCQGMGTTGTVCFVTGERVFVAHVGDSRAYLLRGERLHQVTTDHSLVNELLMSGQITAEEAVHHPHKNVITRALGTDSGVEIDLYEFKIQPGDLLLLCSDGLSNMLSDSDLACLMAEGREKPMEELAKTLVSAANEKGGLDNVTAVLLKKESELCGKDCD